MAKLLNTILGIALIAASSLSAPAAEQNAAEAKLRESLRNTMLQLRTAETERANLQAKNAAVEEEKKALEQKVTAFAKQSAADKEASDKQLADLRSQSIAKDTEIIRLKEDLQKWRTSQKEAADLAAKKEGERAKAYSDGVMLKRKVEDYERKNLELYTIGTEILSRYEKFGLGTALTAREPFVGITKVKLENLVQDYSDKLTDQRIKK